MSRVLDCCNATYYISTFFSREQFRIRMLKERILFPIKEFHPVNNERRYPIGISLVDLPRELDKSFELGF
jgi:hypothetical protein